MKMKRFTVGVAMGGGRVDRYEWHCEDARTAIAWTREVFPQKLCSVLYVEDGVSVESIHKEPNEPLLLLACSLDAFYGGVPVYPPRVYPPPSLTSFKEKQ